MTDYAVMPKADYVAACDAIREKTGDTEVIKSGEIANKINDVYSVGQLSLVKESKYIYPTVSGEVIRIDDMSAVPHKVSVSKRSKNLALATEVFKNTSNYSELVEDERNCVRFVDAGDPKYTGIHFKEKTQYTLSFWYKRTKRMDPCDYGTRVLTFYYADGTRSIISVGGGYDDVDTWRQYTFTTSGGGTITHIGFDSVSYKTWLYIDVDTFQLEEGATQTAYTPYITDFSGIEVYRYGKNLINMPDNLNENTQQPTYDITDICPRDVTISLSATLAREVSAGEYDKRVRINYVVDGTTKYIFGYGEERSVATGIVPSNATSVSFTYQKLINTDGALYWKDTQLEIGTVATDYEPYKEPVEVGETFDSTPNTITLIPDTSGVILECQY